MKILIATRNAHKLTEIRALMPEIDWIGTDAYPDVPDPEENGETFEANARIKAEAWRDATGLPAIADDSGLSVDALLGAPGVFSARYAGVHGDTEANNAKVLAELAGVAPAQRSAHFVCALAYAVPGKVTRTVRGECSGTLLEQPKGANGFGYDPLFVPNGYEQTFGELSADVKAKLSHRARAFAQARDVWFR
ncbi:MAG: RdgB/HAM1 family non-canonical purine NTP pyrophosphatase [Kiritimatiellia bacterium]